MSSVFLSPVEISNAEQRIRPYIRETPLIRYPILEKFVGNGVQIWVKHEDRNALGCFKSRNVLSALVALVGKYGQSVHVVAASTGNHGAALAWAAGLLRLQATVFLSRRANLDLVNTIRVLGGTAIVEGDTYDESRQFAAEFASKSGFILVEATDNRDVVSGAATLTAEIVRQIDEEFILFVSVGGGSQAAGAASVIANSSRTSAVVGVQASSAPAVYQSWRERAPVEIAPGQTIASGLATGKPYRTTFDMLCAGLSDFVIVDEQELKQAVWLAARYTGSFLCGSGAASLAGLVRAANRFAGRTIVLVFSGAAAVSLPDL